MRCRNTLLLSDVLNAKCKSNEASGPNDTMRGGGRWGVFEYINACTHAQMCVGISELTPFSCTYKDIHIQDVLQLYISHLSVNLIPNTCI